MLYFVFGVSSHCHHQRYTECLSLFIWKTLIIHYSLFAAECNTRRSQLFRAHISLSSGRILLCFQAFSFFVVVVVVTMAVSIVVTAFAVVVAVSMVVTCCSGISFSVCISVTLRSTYCCCEVFKEPSLLQHLQRLRQQQQRMIEIATTTNTVTVVPVLETKKSKKREDIHICDEP